MRTGIDILMITYNRPRYTELALSRLLETCDESMRVWLWQNGSDRATLEVVRSFAQDPRVAQFHHSPENVKLLAPTNWLMTESHATYLAKVDDDCLMPSAWGQTLREAHESNAQFGVIGCWPFPEEDVRLDIAAPKIRAYGGGHRVMLNCWVNGSGFLMKRECIQRVGKLRERESFPQYCIRLSRAGWINGWYFPFLFQEHMDDPRSQYCELKCDEDFLNSPPLMAQRWSVRTLAEWTERFREDALYLQKARPDPRFYTGLVGLLRRIWRRFKDNVRGRRAFRAVG
jgi:glycosyltransferase involved in cell wall biosynthesis